MCLPFLKRTDRKWIQLLALCSMLALAPLAVAQTGIVAEFEAGNTTEEVDGFQGKAGNGWRSGWSFNSSHPGAGQVLNTNPIRGGGNYLSVESQAGTRETTLTRSFGAYGSFDPTRYHVVSFDLRVDDISAYAEPASATWMRIFNANAQHVNHAQHTWWAGINSTATGDPGVWTFRSGTGIEDAVQLVVTDIGLAEGVVYSFTFHVHPEASQYRVILTDSTGNLFESEMLYFRGARDGHAGAPALTTAGTHIGFNTQKGNNADIIAENFGYSLDNIRIIPEPGAIALTIGALVLLLGVTVRQSKRRR